MAIGPGRFSFMGVWRNADAAGPNPAAARREGSTPSMPTKPDYPNHGRGTRLRPVTVSVRIRGQVPSPGRMGAADPRSVGSSGSIPERGSMLE